MSDEKMPLIFATDPGCIFCQIAGHRVEAAIVHEDGDIVVFLDRWPVREGHCQIITKQHYSCFDDLPEHLSAKIIHFAQKLAKKMKLLYKIDRVAFAFSGNDVAHVHAHVFPMYQRGDLTSARYFENADEIRYNDARLKVDLNNLEAVRQKLEFK
ncbi:MAG: HIT family protein [Candidatus Rifleibacteriota bacterium]